MSFLNGGNDRVDPRHAGLPVWARKDEGPTNTYVPGPLPTTPLPCTYSWHTRAIVSGLLVLLVGVVVFRSPDAGKASVIVVLVLLWALYAGAGWLRSQAMMRVDGDLAEIRRWRTVMSVRGPDVAEVRYVHQGMSPDFRLTTTDGRHLYVATSRLERGHSVLFEWLRRFAPQARLDARSVLIRQRLQSRGLIAPEGEPPSGARYPGQGGTTPDGDEPAADSQERADGDR